MTEQPSKKRQLLDAYLSRPDTPEDVKAAWKELDGLVAQLTLAASGVLMQSQSYPTEGGST